MTAHGTAWRVAPAKELMPGSGRTVNPLQHQDEVFDLYSIPAFDLGAPSVVPGAEIGSTKQAVAEGDVLLSKIVPHIRRAWVVGPAAGRRQIASSEWIVFRSALADPGFLRHFLVSDLFHRQFMNTVSGVGGSLLRARPTFVAQIPVPLPPLPEQRRIAAILDAADALRAKRRATIAALDTLTQSIFLDMFGEPERNPNGYATVPLGELVRDGRLGIVRSTADLGPDRSVPYIRMDAVTADGRLDLGSVSRADVSPHELATVGLMPGDVLFNTRNARSLVGKCAVFRGVGHYVFNNNLLRLRFDASRVLPEYVWALLQTAHGKRQLLARASGTTSVFAIYAKDLNTLPVPLPRIAEQNLFAARSVAVDTRRATLVAAADRHDRLFSSLQFAAFRGSCGARGGRQG